MTTETKTTEEALERLRADLPEKFTMQWLDDHEVDVLTAVEEFGPRYLQANLGLRTSTLWSWQQRRARRDNAAGAVVETSSADHPVESGSVTRTPLDFIRPNPWQPRKTIDFDYLRGLADSIHTSGLLQFPVGRRLENGMVELAFGHQRVDAIRLLAEEGKWLGGVPIILRELTDKQMALFAMEENAKRRDINQLEQLWAYRKVVDDGLMSVSALADSVGLARSTVSNNLRILHLPEDILERYASAELSSHAARELLCFWEADHDHQDDMRSVLRSITNIHSGAPDWSVKAVRRHIEDRVRNGNKESWRALDEEGGSHYGAANFDVEEFAKDFPTLIHHIPHGEGGAARWTCNVREWRRLQSAATRAQTKASTEDPVSVMDDRETRAFVRTLENDPVMRSVRAGELVASAPEESVSQETPEAAVGEDAETEEDSPKAQQYRALNDWVGKFISHNRREDAGEPCDLSGLDEDCPVCSADRPDDQMWGVEGLRDFLELGVLTDNQIQTAVARAFRAAEQEDGVSTSPPVPSLTEEQVAGWSEVQEKLGTRAGFLQLHKRNRVGFAKKLAGHELPTGFPDLAECYERCTWGAVYGQEYNWSSQMDLYCTNQKHFEEKKARGREAWLVRLKEKVERERREDEEVASFVGNGDQKTLVYNMVLALLGEQAVHRVAMPGGYQERDLYYERRPTTRVREMLGIMVDNGQPADLVFHEGHYARGSVGTTIREKLMAMELPELRELAGHLVAYTMRKGLPEDSDADASYVGFSGVFDDGLDEDDDWNDDDDDGDEGDE